MPIPKLVVTAALMVAQTALTMSRKIKGPRLDETKVSTADYGTPLPRFWGIRRFEASIYWAEELREEKTTTKTKSGKYEGYKYYATFGIVVADQAIDDVTRIWMDRRLVYDKTHAGPISLASVAGFDVSNGMRVYLGTEDQLPDPAYVAWCEDRYGADSAPAYRGVSHVVFEDLPVEDFGNRVPQVSVEAVSVKTVTHPFESLTTAVYSTGGGIVFGGIWGVNYTNGGSPALFEWWDLATRTKIGTSSVTLATGSTSIPGMAADGTFYMFGSKLNDPSSGTNNFLCTIAPGGTPVLTAITNAVPVLLTDATRVLEDGGTRRVYTSYQSNVGYVSGSTHIPHAQSGRDFCIDEDGSVWGLFQPSGSSDEFTIENLVTGASHTFTGSVTRSGPTIARICRVSAYGHFVVLCDGELYTVDDAWSLTSLGAAAFGTSAVTTQNRPNATSIWYVNPGPWEEYSLEDGSLIRSLDPTDWVSGVTRQHATYDPVTQAIWFQNGSSGTKLLYPCYIDRITSSGVTLATIVDTVCDWCGLTGADTSALTQTVTGYSVTQGSGRDMIEPLLSIHDVDARLHDFTLQFVNRGSAPSGTLLTEDFVRDGSGRYEVKIQQDTDLPKKITVTFADVNADQQANTAIFQRPLDAVDSQREDRIDLSTYVTDADDAQQLIDRFGRREWNSRESITNALTAQELRLECADVKTVSLDGELRNARLSTLTIARSDRSESLDCEWVRDEVSFAAVNSSTTGSDMDGHDDEVIVIPPPVRGFVIDAPLAEDADNNVNPLLYDGAGTYAGLSFMGAAIFRGDDGSYDELFDTISTGATWGICNDTLADADPWLWDRGNTLNVSLQSGSLTSVTEADIDADPTLNLILVGSTSGWEYINFTTATLEADGTYTLSGFKRGRRGTEWMTGSHASGEAWILASSLVSETVGVSEVGAAMSFKAQSVGRSIDSAPAIGLTYTGATLKPYAPARIKWTTDGTDMFGEIIRRTRVGGSYPSSGWSIPLSENSEEYEVDILDGSGNVLRTITVTGGNTFTYAAADIASDGNTVGVEPSYNAYQISDAVGRGFALAA